MDGTHLFVAVQEMQKFDWIVTLSAMELSLIGDSTVRVSIFIYITFVTRGVAGFLFTRGFISGLVRVEVFLRGLEMAPTCSHRAAPVALPLRGASQVDCTRACKKAFHY